MLYSDSAMKKFLFVLAVFSGALASAEEKTFTREYTYQASEYDSRASAKDNALEQVRRILSEDAADYILERIKENPQGKTISARIGAVRFPEQRKLALVEGFAKTKILAEKWTGAEYWIRAMMEIHPDDLKITINAILMDGAKFKDLAKESRKADAVLGELEKWGKDLAWTRPHDDEWLTGSYSGQPNAAKASGLFEKGRRAYEEGKYGEAVVFYLEALNSDPYYPFVYHNNLGAVYDALGSYTEAIKNYERALASRPQDGEIYFNLGKAYGHRGDFPGAIKNYEEALARNPDDVEIYFSLGEAHGRQGHYSEAIRSYKDVLARTSDDADAYYGVGNAYRHLGDYPEAQAWYEEALLRNPSDADVHYSLGNIYEQQGRYSEAIGYYEAALALEPDHSFAGNMRKSAYKELVEAKAGIEVVSPRGWAEKGQRAYEDGEYAEAVSFFTKAIAMKSGEAHGYFISLGNVYYDWKKYTKAIESYGGAIKQKPDFADAYGNMGAAYWQQGNASKAIESYRMAVEWDRDDALIYNNMGLIYDAQEDYEKALRAYEEALARNPGYSDAYWNSSIARYSAGDPEGGLGDRKKAAALGHRGAQNWLRAKKISW